MSSRTSPPVAAKDFFRSATLQLSSSPSCRPLAKRNQCVATQSPTCLLWASFFPSATGPSNAPSTSVPVSLPEASTG